MALADEEYIRVVEELRLQLGRLEERELLEQAWVRAQGAPESPANPRSLAIGFLEATIVGLRRRSVESYRETLGLLNQHLRTSEGLPIANIVVTLAEPDQIVARQETVSLSELPRYGELVQDLEAVHVALKAL